MGWSPHQDALRGRVAVVAGATRGAGRGIAAALGEAGATVVCTGRSTRSARSGYNRPETIEETAELVTRLGGTGVAIALDHLDRERVKELSHQIRKDYGHVWPRRALLQARVCAGQRVEGVGERGGVDLHPLAGDRLRGLREQLRA